MKPYCYPIRSDLTVPRRYCWSGCLAILCFAAAGCNDPSRASPAQAQAVSPSAGERVDRVTAGSPQRKTLELYTTQPAAIRAFEESPLYTRVSGYVRKVHVDIGDRVEQGDLLIEIDAAELHDDVARYQAFVAQAARIRLERREDVLALPVSALVYDDAGTRCCVVVDEKIEFRSVETGLRSGDQIEIVSGVSENDRVVLARAAGLVQGQRVEIIQPAP